MAGQKVDQMVVSMVDGRAAQMVVTRVVWLVDRLAVYWELWWAELSEHKMAVEWVAPMELMTVDQTETSTAAWSVGQMVAMKVLESVEKLDT